MPNFDCGVASYITGETTIRVNFPVDAKGNADISCKQCFLFSRQSGKCYLTGKPSEYPDHFVGSECPLTETIETEDQ